MPEQSYDYRDRPLAELRRESKALDDAFAAAMTRHRGGAVDPEAFAATVAALARQRADLTVAIAKAAASGQQG